MNNQSRQVTNFDFRINHLDRLTDNNESFFSDAFDKRPLVTFIFSLNLFSDDQFDVIRET